MIWIAITYACIILFCGFCFRKESKWNKFFYGRNMPKWIVSMSVGSAFICGMAMLTIPVKSGGNQILRCIMTIAGILIGYALQWIVVSRRLRVYSEIAGDGKTFSQYLGNRFDDKQGILCSLCSVILLIFSVLFASTLMSAVAEILSAALNLNYIVALFVIALVLTAYLITGGTTASIGMDVVRMILIIFISIGAIIYFISAGGSPETLTLQVRNTALADVGHPNGIMFADIYPLFGMALAVFCMPQSAMRFAFTKKRCNAKIFGVHNLILVAPALILIGIIGCAGGVSTIAETAFAEATASLFDGWQYVVVICSYFLIMFSMLDSQITTAVSSFAEDLYPKIINKNAKSSEITSMKHVTIFIVIFISAMFAINSDGVSVVSPAFIWTVFAASFGPSLIFPLYMKKATWISSFASIVAGTVASLFCVYGIGLDAIATEIPFLELLLSLAVSTLVYFVVYAIAPKNTSKKTENEFSRVDAVFDLKSKPADTDIEQYYFEE